MKLKRISVLVCLLTCLFMFAGCSAKEAETQTQLPYDAAQVQQITEGLLTQFANAPATELEQLIAQKAKNLSEDGDVEYGLAIQSAAQTFLDSQNDLGAYQNVVADTFTMAVDGETVNCTVDAQFANRTATFTVIYDDEITKYETAKIEPHYTVGENLAKAGLNTLMGMGTVFIVLIFIAFIISLFKYINIWEKGLAAKKQAKVEAEKAAKAAERAAKAPAKAPAPAPAPVPVQTAAPVSIAAAPQVDDLELIAVITAAAASMMNKSVDQLYVRSIKKSRTNRRIK